MGIVQQAGVSLHGGPSGMLRLAGLCTLAHSASDKTAGHSVTFVCLNNFFPKCGFYLLKQLLS